MVKDYKILFYIFLLKKNIYKRYFEGISEHLTRNPSYVEPIYNDSRKAEDYICNAFSWYHENLNHEKRINWEAMHRIWLTILKKYKQCQMH
jgi:hypothetical protein